ncbi:MAG: SPOR domain-containing protein [Glaciecola sp.]
MKYTTKSTTPIALCWKVMGVLLLISLSGCLSTISPTKPNVVQQIQQQEIKDKIDQHVAEFKTIKPAIDRLIAMENDFKVMVSQIAKINTPSEHSGLMPVTTAYASQTDTQTAPVPLDPHSNKPELELLYVSDTAVEPDPIFALAPVSPQTAIIVEPVVTLQAAEQPLKDTDPILDNAKSKVHVAQVRLFPATRYETCAPLGVQSDARKYGIHVASFNTLDSLPRGWHDSVQRFPDFCEKGAVIQKVVVKNKQFYSMRVGPYVSRSEAKSICYALKKQKQYCRVTDFTGETL